MRDEMDKNEIESLIILIKGYLAWIRMMCHFRDGSYEQIGTDAKNAANGLDKLRTLIKCA